MTRQLDIQAELRESNRRDHLVRALEFGIVGALESQGVELLGFALKYDAFNCLLTLKAVVSGAQSVCFVGSDSIINCFIKAERDALSDELHWRPDKYHQK